MRRRQLPCPSLHSIPAPVKELLSASILRPSCPSALALLPMLLAMAATRSVRRGTWIEHVLLVDWQRICSAGGPADLLGAVSARAVRPCPRLQACLESWKMYPGRDVSMLAATPVSRWQDGSASLHPRPMQVPAPTWEKKRSFCLHLQDLRLHVSCHCCCR